MTYSNHLHPSMHDRLLLPNVLWSLYFILLPKIDQNQSITICMYVCVCVYIYIYIYLVVFMLWASEWKLLSRVQFFEAPWTLAHQTPLPVEFSRQEYWSGLPFPSPGDLPYSGNPTWVSCMTGRLFTIWATREAHIHLISGEFHGERSLMGYSPWGLKELGTTEQLTLSLFAHTH